MNTQQLRCFIMVADKLSFTKAAQELFFSVPTVTHHIQNLETELGTKLFIREKKGVTLTPAGKAFYPSAADIIMRYDTAVQSIKSQSEFEVFNIGCTSHAEMTMLTSVFSEFRKKYPNIVPHIETDNFDKILDMFESHQLDIVFATNNMLKKRKGNYNFSKLGTRVGHAVVDKAHPIAQKEEISFEELENETVIGLNRAFVPSATENKVTKLMQLHHLKSRDILCEDDRLALSLCKAGYGIAVLPSYCIPEYFDAIGLACVPIKESQLIIYGMITRKEEQKEYYRYFINLTEKKFKTSKLK